MVGQGVLLECLDHEQVESVLSIGRSQLDLEHPQLKQLVHKDFSEFNSVRDQLQGYQACYLCMGVSAAGLSAERYNEVTYDYTMSLAQVLYDLNPQMTWFTFRE